MEITLTLDYGPLNAEFSGENREELQDELLEFAEFLGEEKEALSSLPAPQGNNESEEGGVQTPVTEWEDDSDPNPTPDTGDAESTHSEFSSFATKTGVGEGTLSKLIDLPDNEEGVPSLKLYHFDEGTEVLGKYRNQRQAQASALLLYAWEECLDRKKVTYEDLDRALTNSDIETERRDAMVQAFADEAREWFEYEEGEKIWVLGTGKNHVRELLQDVQEKLAED